MLIPCTHSAPKPIFCACLSTPDRGHALIATAWFQPGRLSWMSCSLAWRRSKSNKSMHGESSWIRSLFRAALITGVNLSARSIFDYFSLSFRLFTNLCELTFRISLFVFGTRSQKARCTTGVLSLLKMGDTEWPIDRHYVIKSTFPEWVARRLLLII